MNSLLSGKPAPQEASSKVSPESAALRFIRNLKTPCRILVAYSGGGDSTGLLVALAAGRKAGPDLEISLVAATVDHGLRAGSADEAESAGALCADLGIPHHILTWAGEKPRTGIQAAARAARYRLLTALAEEIRADVIVTAHTLDDQVETIEMRRARSPDAMSGMSEAVLCDRRIWVFRPFLNVLRADIRDYLVSHDIGWIDDPSNDNTAFERVRIRQALAARPDRPASDASVPARRTLGRKAAQFLRANAKIHSARVAVVDLSAYSPAEPAHLLAILHLAAVIGGRTHLAGKETTTRIAQFLERRQESRMTAERVVFDRRKNLLYIAREKRSLPEATVPPGSNLHWDGRFAIRNEGDAPVRISAGTERGGEPLLPGPLPPNLPPTVVGRIRATEPRLLEGDARDVFVEPILATFVHFLPLDLLEIADALAFLVGLDHFHELPMG
jgi:tRNA(Ile)-lysidine synthase